MNINGIILPVPTPFLNDEVAYDKLASNILKWNQTDISGYLVMGSNGESAYLTREEKLKIVEVTKKNLANDKILIAGTGSDSIKETINLTNEAAKLGADTALILTPSFYKGKMTHPAFNRYFNEVAEDSMIPILIYNVPKFTGVEIEARTVAELSRHPNIIGIKHSSENMGQLAEIINLTPSDFNVIVGTASVLFAGLCLGAVGGILALANIAPEMCIKLQNYINDNNIEEARELQLQLLSANKAVTAQFGVAGLKAAMDMLGYFGGQPRSPLQSLDDNGKTVLKRILEESNILS